MWRILFLFYPSFSIHLFVFLKRVFDKPPVNIGCEFETFRLILRLFPENKCMKRIKVRMFASSKRSTNVLRNIAEGMKQHLTKYKYISAFILWYLVNSFCSTSQNSNIPICLTFYKGMPEYLTRLRYISIIHRISILA